jgi:hypothetical protein
VIADGPMLLGSEDGFRPLWNGENFDGWINVNCAPETWTIRDDVIVCTGIPTGVLRTDRQYENYILELEWRHLHPRGNAGLFLHSWDITALGQPFTRSIECQIMDGNGGDIFSIHGATLVPITPHLGGWLRALPTENRVRPAGGEWNHYRVESRNGMVSLAVNGKVVTQAVNCNPRKGYICLESEGSEVHFRNIHIKELPGDNPPPDVVAQTDRGFRSLYNGLDLRGWKQVPGNEGHWTAENWILKYDGKSEAEGENRNLWTEEAFGNFILIVDWRQPAKPTIDHVPVILPDGSYAVDDAGKSITAAVKDAGDSGVYLRGSSKSQINIWNWPCGSGEIWGYRLDETLSPDARRGATPILNADNAIGEWNRFEITCIGDRVTVVLNEKTVIRDAQLPGMPKRGPIALQHHGDPMQFANIYIKELE